MQSLFTLGKCCRKIFELIEEDYFPENSKILAFHTGGLQGIKGANEMLKRKQKFNKVLYIEFVGTKGLEKTSLLIEVLGTTHKYEETILIFNCLCFHYYSSQTLEKLRRSIHSAICTICRRNGMPIFLGFIILCKGLLETGGGQSRLAQEGKNHFGIKWKKTDGQKP